MFRNASSMGNSQILFFEDPVELVGDRTFHLFGDKTEPRGQTMPGAESPADQFDRFGHRFDELVDPPPSPVQEPEERQRAPDNGDHRDGDGREAEDQPKQVPVTPSPATTDMNRLKEKLTSACS